MGKVSIEYKGDIEDNTELYRYMSFSQFVSLVEFKQIYLTKFDKWDDKWEAPLHACVLDESGTMKSVFSVAEILYGQCWSLNRDSDALWRIYASNKEGIMIKTTAKKFKSISGIDYAILGRVKYTDLKKDGEFSEDIKEMAFKKRMPFQHESEVRLVTTLESNERDTISVDVDPLSFIEEIVIHPGASDWFKKTVIKYCENNQFTHIPKKSELYLFKFEEIAYYNKLKTDRN